MHIPVIRIIDPEVVEIVGYHHLKRTNIGHCRQRGEKIERQEGTFHLYHLIHQLFIIVIKEAAKDTPHAANRQRTQDPVEQILQKDIGRQFSRGLEQAKELTRLFVLRKIIAECHRFIYQLKIVHSTMET